MGDRRVDYKKGKSSAERVQEKARDSAVSLRKQKKNRLLSAKRLRHEEAGEGGNGSQGESVDIAGIVAFLLANGVSLNEVQQVEELRKVRKFLSGSASDIDRFLSAERAMDLLMSCLGENFEQTVQAITPLQREAAWCFVNISGRESRHTKACLLASKQLLSFVNCADKEMQDLCVNALGNIAGDSAENGEVLIQLNTIEIVIMGPLRNPDSTFSTVRNCCFLLSNLARGQEVDLELFYEGGIIESTIEVLRRCKGNIEVLTELFWLLTYVTANVSDGLSVMLFETDFVTALFCCLEQHFISSDSGNYLCVTPIFRIVGNVIGGSSYYASCIVDNEIFAAQLLSASFKCLTSEMVMQTPEYRDLKLECLWVLSNLTSNRFEEAEKFIRSGFHRIVIPMLFESLDVRTEVMYCLLNVSFHSPEFLETIIYTDEPGCNVLVGVNSCLKANSIELTVACLELFEMIATTLPDGVSLVEEYGGIEQCEKLLEHCDNEQIHELASVIIQVCEVGSIASDEDEM
eukprot:Nk52_evm33s1129 gene=Nk52_evmTU33s1129